MKKLSIITLTYNSEKFIKGYLNSLNSYLPQDSEVIIVDNASEDKTKEIVKKYNFVKLIGNNKNLGFSRGCNIGAKSADGKFLLFLNPDSKILDNSIELMLEFANENPTVGIIAPKLIQPNNEIQPSVRKLPSILGAISEYYLGLKRSYEAFVPKDVKPQRVESVVGAAILLKKEIFEKVGGFDEKFFMYYEDLDLCKKIKKLGLDIIYFPEAKIVHIVGGSISKEKKQYIESSALTYHGLINYLILKIILLFRPANLVRKFKGS